MWWVKHFLDFVCIPSIPCFICKRRDRRCNRCWYLGLTWAPTTPSFTFWTLPIFHIILPSRFLNPALRPCEILDLLLPMYPFLLYFVLIILESRESGAVRTLHARLARSAEFTLVRSLMPNPPKDFEVQIAFQSISLQKLELVIIFPAPKFYSSKIYFFMTRFGITLHFIM